MENHMRFLKGKKLRVEIDSDTFKKIIKEAAELKIKNIIFIGGEPFLREDLFDLVGYAKKSGLSVTIITNGVLLNKKNAELCCASGVDVLNISLDAASEEVFHKIRGENVLGTILQNLTNFNRLKIEKKTPLPRISATCSILNDNLEELLDVIDLCRTLKIDNIAFQPVVIDNVNQSDRNFSSPVFIPQERLPILDASINKLINYKEKHPEFVFNSIKHLNLIKKYFRRDFRKNSAWPCYAGYNRLQITQDYVLYFCIPPNDQYKTSFGDVSKDRLKDLWYSKNARIRRKLIKKCIDPCLQACSYRYDFIKAREFLQIMPKNVKNCKGQFS